VHPSCSAVELCRYQSARTSLPGLSSWPGGGDDSLICVVDKTTSASLGGPGAQHACAHGWWRRQRRLQRTRPPWIVRDCIGTKSGC
jgi:hypothetical protein